MNNQSRLGTHESRLIDKAYDRAIAFADKGMWAEAYSEAHQLKVYGLDFAAEELADSIYCRKNDC